MTDAQILAAARILCEKRGLDPDERIAVLEDTMPRGPSFMPAIYTYEPRYLYTAREIRAFDELRNACDAALLENSP